MADKGIRIHHIFRRNCGEGRFFVLFKALIRFGSLGVYNCAPHGRFQEKEKNSDYWIEYYPVAIFFEEN